MFLAERDGADDEQRGQAMCAATAITAGNLLSDELERTGAGETVTMQLPDGCPSGLIDVPMLPGATHGVNEPGVLTYDTAATLDYQKGKQGPTIFINTAAGVTSVNMLLTRSQ